MTVGILDEIGRLFRDEGAAEYFGEPVTQAEHMCQAAFLAEKAGAPDHLVAAALLHDVGHFQGALSGADLMRGVDNNHGETGAAWLSQWFAEEVTEPVRLHIAAKRYLCAVEPDYFARLSPASVYTLSVQGGPMSPSEADDFTRSRYAGDAIAIRRWDDEAKDQEVVVPGFDAYLDLLTRLVTR